MRAFLAGCGLLAIMTATPVLAGVKEGVDAWMAGDYPKAVAEWRGPAASGDPDAQFNLGQAYKLGRGVAADQNQAMDWYRKAAASDHEQAQATLGLALFQNGKRDEAMQWLKKAADHGEPRAQYVVGTAYFNGDSLPKDWTRAYAFMTRAKAAGIGAASTSLAQMDSLVPEPQKQAGLAIAREMERSDRLKNADAGAGSPLTLRSSATPPSAPAAASRAPGPAPIGQVAIPASQPPAPVVTAPIKPAPSAAAAVAPPPKPAPVAPKPAIAQATPPKPAAKPPVAPSAGGQFRIQLGAFGTPGAAQSAWAKISGSAGLKALTPYYVPVGAMTRLQAGPFGTRSAANSACDSVKATGTGCFPVAP